MRSLLTLSLTTLLAAAPAAAATLHTPPLHAGFGGHVLTCSIRNVGASTRTVTIDLLDYAGNVVAGHATSVAGGEIEALVGSNKPSASSCRFTLSGSTKTVRGQAIYYDADDYEFEVVLPAE